jgi:AraC-like DNA-binding protein
MWYQTELRFLQSMLKKVNLQFLLLTKEELPINPTDLGIRKFLGREAEYRRMFCELPFEASQNTIYKLTDSFLCNYLYLMLPGESPTVLLVGPYMLVQLTQHQLLQEAERFSVPPQLFKEMENYYGSIPVLNDERFLFSIINSLAEVLWGSSESFTVVDLKEDQILPSPFSPEVDPIPLEKTLLSMEDMERRYTYENEVLRAVSLGMSHKAELMLSNFNQLAIKQRVADPLRNIKNYCIIMNTLMRKAAEQGSVHPLYLDRVSSEFARKIEITGATSAGYKLMAEMISTYCRLVNKHSMTTYSLPIRKTLVCIDANLSGDLTLHTMAAMQNISSGYLSALFKKEVGQTLTDYVNRRRIKQAKQLLHSTVLQIQTIAQYCGIPDVNYFSKTFKRHCGCTPKDFRQSLQTQREKP